MKKLSLLAALVSAAMLSACGNDDDDNQTTGTPAAETTSFAITVDAPPSLVAPQVTGFSWLSQAYADPVTSLTRDNFTVAIIDADGNVVEEVTLSDDQWSQEPDGSYVITLPGGQRLDCVILVDLDGTPAVQLGQPLPSDNLFAPTLGTEFQVDLSSTAAYRAIVDEIASTDGWGDYASAVSGDAEASALEVALALVEGVVDAFEEQIEEALASVDGDFDLEDILNDSALLELAENVVERIETEISAEEADVAALLEQGLWWIDTWEYGDGQLEIEAGNFQFDGTTTTESIYAWDMETGDAPSLSAPDETIVQSLDNVDTTNLEIERWILASDGSWLADYDALLVRSADASSASVTNVGLHSDSSFDRQVNFQSLQIAGASIPALLATEDTLGLLDFIAANASFSDQAAAYLGSEDVPMQYQLSNWDGENCMSLSDVEGCNRVYMNMGGGAEQAPPSSLDELFSDTAAEDDDYAMTGVWINDSGLLAEFVQDDAQSVFFWQVDHDTQTTTKKPFSSTWALTTVNGQQLLTSDFPLALIAYGIDSDDLSTFFVVAEGYVRRGEVQQAESESFYVFNQTAIEDIIAAYSSGSCDLSGIEEDFNQAAFLSFLEGCAIIDADDAMDDLYDSRLARVRSAGDTRAFEFNEDGSVGFYKGGVPRSDKAWESAEGQLIELDYGEGETSLMALVDFQQLSNELTVAVFDSYADGSTEAWYFTGKLFSREGLSDGCFVGESEWDDENGVPFEGTEKTIEDYPAAIAACQETIGGRSAKFVADNLFGNGMESLRDEGEYYLFYDTAASTSGWYEGMFVSEQDQEEIPLIWQVNDAGQLLINATFPGENGDIELSEILTIAQTDGVEVFLKIFAQQSNWAEDFDYMDDAEGEIWSDLRAFFRP